MIILHKKMSIASEKPENLSDIIDRIDLLREELLAIQRSLERMAGEASVPPGRTTEKRSV